MNLSLLSIVQLASIPFSFLSFILLIVLFKKITELKSSGRRLISLEKRAHGKLNKKLEEESEKELDKVFLQVSELFADEVRTQASEFSKGASEEIKKFSQFLAGQQESIIKKSEVMVATAVNKSNEDVEAFKKAQMAAISKKVYMVVAEASKEVVAKSLNPNEHEELVTKAVEKAKSENFFI